MKKLSAIMLIVTILFTMLSIPVQAIDENTLEDTTPSGIVYDDIDTEIEDFATSNTGKYASFATSVFKGDKILYSKHDGYIDRENKILADENSVYEWGSISKLLVWVSVMQLNEAGKLDLNTDIREYLPEGFLTKLKYNEPITMLNLMNHNAGWQEVMSNTEVANEADIISLEQALKNTEPAQAFKPGEVTAYSNWGTALAGYIVQRISGLDYSEYVHKNIFEPLGMKHTSISSNYKDTPWVREQREKEKSYLISTQGENKIDESLGTAMFFILLYPAGSATGTLADITTFAQSFVSDNCVLFKNKKTLDLLLSASDFYGDSDIPKICHGLFVTEYAIRTLGHGGNTMAGSANLVFDRDSKTGVVVLTNQQIETTFCNGIPEIIFGVFKDNPIYTNRKITKQPDISGNYAVSRGVFEGNSKIFPCFNYLSLKASDNPNLYTYDDNPILTRISDNIYCFSDYSSFLYSTTNSNGKVLLESSSTTYIKNDLLIYEFISVIVLAVIVGITLIALIVKAIKKLAKKYKPEPAGKAILVGQLSKVIVAILVAVYLLCTVELAPTVITIICIAIGLFSLLCLVSAIFTLKALIIESEIKVLTRVRYIISILCNVYTLGFVIYFQLFNFWL